MKTVYSVDIEQYTLQYLLTVLSNQVETPLYRPEVIALVNTFSLVEAHRNPYHLSNLSECICIADGWPIAALARTERIAGADLMLAVARHPMLQQARHTLYGGFGVAYDAAMKQYEAARSRLIVMPWMPPRFSEATVVDIINRTKPDILWVALGCPKQEAWMVANRERLNAKVIIGVGAAFNYLAGAVKRAPRWMQRCGLEGVYRIWAEPERWKRQVEAGVGLVRLLLLQRS